MTKYCSSKCELFRCGKKAILNQGNRAWCKWTDEECKIENCSYATCVRRRLLPRGICGEKVKRKTVEKEPEEILDPPIRLKGKVLRKVRENELY